MIERGDKFQSTSDECIREVIRVEQSTKNIILKCIDCKASSNEEFPIALIKFEAQIKLGVWKKI